MSSADVAAPAAPNVSQDPYPPGSSATKLRQMLDGSSDIVVCPGVYDGFSARIALEVGFDALYMTGAGTTASKLGQADLGIAQLHDMRANAEMISSLNPSVPVIADMDTGYGGPIMVARSVTQYAMSGVAGFHIEDQVQAKRCGHLQGKQLVDIETFVSRIRAAVAARQKIGSDIVVIARTDALQSFGYDESVRRLKAARDAGADVAFLEGLDSVEMGKQIVQDMAPTPVLLNMVEHGTTPTMSVKEAKEIGFRLIIWPFAALAPAYVAIKATMEKLKQDGVAEAPKELSPRRLFEVCGLGESMALDKAAGGQAFEKGA
ncbi:2,3-Dimethylmalate lyase [Eremomyces bilateralis CBS 781.70]|uniref:2,3-Dimethylmalate lyase n=1 Tax=Eremomyces bilateralis CBS 781.70 TaxID=1392243 RepID=A0A6G1FRQ1_9PEZI|nr:2,3-Dimethylmalate lyase [Eremomyces bilateralis CBS 781.70]KAF1808390.1 2,3-Dimethylmalate lyase [Eremomyces bilateralis CBS 781.70]